MIHQKRSTTLRVGQLCSGSSPRKSQSSRDPSKLPLRAAKDWWKERSMDHTCHRMAIGWPYPPPIFAPEGKMMEVI